MRPRVNELASFQEPLVGLALPSEVPRSDNAFDRRLPGMAPIYPARSFASSALAAGSEDAGFCPVISKPSATTWGCQSSALEYLPLVP